MSDLEAQMAAEAARAEAARLAAEAAEAQALKDAPHSRPVRRLDEVKAAKRAIVKYGFEEHPDQEPDRPEGGAVEAQKSA